MMFIVLPDTSLILLQHGKNHNFQVQNSEVQNPIANVLSIYVWNLNLKKLYFCSHSIKNINPELQLISRLGQMSFCQVVPKNLKLAFPAKKQFLKVRRKSSQPFLANWNTSPIVLRKMFLVSSQKKSRLINQILPVRALH